MFIQCKLGGSKSGLKPQEKEELIKLANSVGAIPILEHSYLKKIRTIKLN